MLGKDAKIILWVDVKRSAIHIEFQSKQKTKIKISYEIWRDDTIEPKDNEILFCHRNTASNLLDERLKQQGIEHLKKYFPDVEKTEQAAE